MGISWPHTSTSLSGPVQFFSLCSPLIYRQVCRSPSTYFTKFIYTSRSVYFSDTQVEAEIVLGLSGVLIVILSVSSAIGLCSYMQIPGQYQWFRTVTVIFAANGGNPRSEVGGKDSNNGTCYLISLPC